MSDWSDALVNKPTFGRRQLLVLSAAAAGAVMLDGVRASTAIETPAIPRLIRQLHGHRESRTSLNREWRFLRSDAYGAQAETFDDRAWDVVGLPHSFSLPYFRGVDFYVGFGWYRKSLYIDPRWQGKRIAIEFEAAFQEAQVYVNGAYAGAHRGGFTSFQLDIAHLVRPGNNTLAVRVNNLWNPEIAPRAGDHIFDGGLYRNVWLVVTEPLRIAWQGVGITTPHVTERSATVKVEIQVENFHTLTRDCRSVSKIIDPSGRQVAEIRTQGMIPSGGVIRLSGVTQVEKPLLWHPDHPHLYRVETTLYDDSRSVEERMDSLGIRTFDWTAEKGFFLNGRHLWIHGANVHQDHAGWASGATDAGAWRDVRLIKEAGFNFIRTSHYPHSRAFMEACDYYGILVWSEMCFWGVGGFGPDGNWRASAYPEKPEHWSGFENSCLEQLAEMIAMHRNHPSIVAWSMCNEVFFTAPAVFNRMKDLLKKMVLRTHELDPSRPAGIGGAQRGGVDKLGDIAGYNGDGATLYINPGFPNLVTEYGSVASTRPGPYSPNWGLLQRQHFAWRSGAAIWCGFDYGTWVGFTGEMGIVDYFRLPKNSWYWYRMHNRHIPPAPPPGAGKPTRLHLSADRAMIHGTDAIEDAQIVVSVVDDAGRLCNVAPDVQLEIISGPGELPTGRSIRFGADSDIAIIAGLAAIEFRSYHAGESVIRAQSPGLADAILRIRIIGAPRFIPGHTPLVKPRPYNPVPHPNQNTYVKHIPRHIDIALYRPTESSGAMPGHLSSLADDGSSTTAWFAPPGKGDPWWQIDLEGEFDIRDLSIAFPVQWPVQFRLQFSVNQRNWSRPMEHTVPTGSRKMDIRLPHPKRARFVRITLLRAPPDGRGISEVVIHGKVAGQK